MATYFALIHRQDNGYPAPIRMANEISELMEQIEGAFFSWKMTKPDLAEGVTLEEYMEDKRIVRITVSEYKQKAAK